LHPYICRSSAQAPDLGALIEKARSLISHAKSPATLKAYRNDWRDFESWCRAHNLPSLPSTPEIVVLYASDLASTHAVSTITRRLTSITKAHQAAGIRESPASSRHFVVCETLKGIRRLLGTEQTGKTPLLTADIRKIVASCPDSVLGYRDRALVLTCFAGAFRRSEAAHLRVTDVRFDDRFGAVVHLRYSKTDPEGAGRDVGIPSSNDPKTCPVRALRAWLSEAKITNGFVFRRVDRFGYVSRRGLHSDSIGKLIKRASARSGLTIDQISGHSLRAGCVTQAAMNGVPEHIIMKQTGHKTVATLRRYIRDGEIFRDNAAAGLGI
jgi:integrase